MGQILLQINRWSQYIHVYKAPTIIMLMIKVTRTIYTQAYKISYTYQIHSTLATVDFPRISVTAIMNSSCWNYHY